MRLILARLLVVFLKIFNELNKNSVRGGGENFGEIIVKKIIGYCGWILKILGTLVKILEKLFTNFENVLEYNKMLIDLKNFKEILWKFGKNSEKF